MSPEVVGAVLLAAVLHAAWNAIIKGGSEKLFEAVLKTMGGGVAVVFILPFMPLPAKESWPLLATSCSVHILYYTFLGLAYRHSDMTCAYTIMRGSAPLLTALAMTIFMGVPLTGAGWAGILCISLGIFVLTFDSLKHCGFSARGLLAALGTSLVICCYTLADGYGARSSGNAVSYTLWLFFVNAFPMTIALNFLYGRRFRDYARLRWRFGLLGGVCSFGSYAVAIWAMTKAPIAMVAALRETSVIFGMLMAVFILKEKFTMPRSMAVLLVACGTIVMRF